MDETRGSGTSAQPLTETRINDKLLSAVVAVLAIFLRIQQPCAGMPVLCKHTQGTAT
jgi:hypothetical protein